RRADRRSGADLLSLPSPEAAHLVAVRHRLSDPRRQAEPGGETPHLFAVSRRARAPGARRVAVDGHRRRTGDSREPAGQRADPLPAAASRRRRRKVARLRERMGMLTAPIDVVSAGVTGDRDTLPHVLIVSDTPFSEYHGAGVT